MNRIDFGRKNVRSRFENQVFMAKTSELEDPKRFLDNIGFKKVLKILLDSRKAEFATELSEISLCTVVKHRIYTGTARPITCRSRRYRPQDTAIISAEVKRLLDNNLIVESAAEWASPLLLVPKPDNSKRACVDFRSLNFVTKKDVHISLATDRRYL